MYTFKKRKVVYVNKHRFIIGCVNHKTALVTKFAYKKQKKRCQSYLSGLTVCKEGAVSLVRVGRERARDASSFDDKRAESGRNEATEHRHWLILTHEADECEKGCTFTIKSLADYILKEDEGDCGVFGF